MLLKNWCSFSKQQKKQGASILHQKQELAWDLPTVNYLIWYSAARGEKYHSKGTGTIKFTCI
jgi:hypothetical protein